MHADNEAKRNVIKSSLDSLLSICLTNSFKPREQGEQLTVDNFIHTIKPEVIAVMALLINKIVSVEPEILLNSQYFNEIVELLCKVLLFVYEKEMVENTLSFFHHLIFKTATNKVSPTN